MSKPDKYPTWRRLSATRIISEEQMDGTPDFYIRCFSKGHWYVSWRTSAHWSGPYATAADAMNETERETKRSVMELMGLIEH